MVSEQKTDILFDIPLPVQEVLDRLCDAGYQAFLVGGCVRDVLRGVQPHDYDLTTDALPNDMHRVLHELHVIDTGIQHGTLTVLHGGMAMEVTTYRVDGSYLDNRHPDAVRFTASLREDVARRDFTMNALAYHPAVGLCDYFGGRADIAARCIRAVGDPMRRFEEDALRILRALRFSSALGFTIEPATAAAARTRAPLLRGISAERVHEELDRLLCGEQVASVLCKYSDVLAVVLPSWAAVTDDASVSQLAACIAALPTDRVVRYAALLSFLPCTAA